MNTVALIGVLMNNDEIYPEIRYIVIKRDYEIYSNNQEDDVIGIMNWNKEKKGEINSFKEGSLVAIRGRIESYKDRPVIIVETIQYLGK